MINITTALRDRGIGVGKKLEGDAAAGDVRAGKIFMNVDGKQTGALADRGNGGLVVPSTANQVFQAGIYNGDITVQGDVDLVTGNVKAGANIFGVAGKPEVVDTTEAAAPAAAANILTGKKAFVNGGLVTGTMVDRAGDTAALSSAVAGTALKLKASAGYRDGVNDYVTITDADFVEANIKNGVNIFGKTGTYSGKQFATGTATGVTGVNAENIVYTGIIVNGLAFTPSLIIAHKQGIVPYQSFAVYNALVNVKVRADTSAPAQAYCDFLVDGFELHVPSTGTYDWIAIE